MGGHAAGEVASKITVETIGEFIASTRQKEEATWPFKYNHSLDFNSNRLAVAIEKANERVMAAVAAQPWLKGMGTTVVAGLLNEKILSLAHVGDSRAYLYRGRAALAPDRRPLVGARAGGGRHPDGGRGEVASAEERRHAGARREAPSVAPDLQELAFSPRRPLPLLLGRPDDDALRRGDRGARPRPNEDPEKLCRNLVDLANEQGRRGQHHGRRGRVLHSSEPAVEAATEGVAARRRRSVDFPRRPALEIRRS